MLIHLASSQPMNTNDQNLRFSLIQQGCLVALYDKYIYKNHPEQIYKAIKKTPINFNGWWLTRRQVYLNVKNPFWYFEHWTPKIRLFVFVGKCIVETLYNTSCIIAHVNSSQSRVNRQDIGDCLFNKDAGFG